MAICNGILPVSATKDALVDVLLAHIEQGKELLQPKKRQDKRVKMSLELKSKTTDELKGMFTDRRWQPPKDNSKGTDAAAAAAAYKQKLLLRYHRNSHRYFHRVKPSADFDAAIAEFARLDEHEVDVREDGESHSDMVYVHGTCDVRHPGFFRSVDGKADGAGEDMDTTAAAGTSADVDGTNSY